MNLSSSSSLDLSSTAATTAGCLTGTLRRLLCRSLRRTTPRDAEIAETAIVPEPKAAEQQNSPVPSIVARLMGLESMPAPPPRSIGRSRSTNSLDSWPGFLSDRRKSSSPVSQSFREVPTHLREENEEFLLLSFTPDDDEGTFSSSGTKPNMGFRELREVNAEPRIKSKKESKTGRTMAEKRKCCRENISKRNCGSAKPSNHQEMRERPMNARKKLACTNLKFELECSSQNSSPVSVLDPRSDTDGEFLNSPGSPVSGDDSKPKRRNSRRKLSSELADRNDPSPSIHFSKIYNGGMRSIDEQDNELRKPKQAYNDSSEMWGDILCLAEEDVKISNWVSREIQKSEDRGDLAALIGVEVLDSLLYETVADLSDCTVKI